MIFKEIHLCYICRKRIKQSITIYHVNIMQPNPVKFFCTKACKQKYLDKLKVAKKHTSLLDWLRDHSELHRPK